MSYTFLSDFCTIYRIPKIQEKLNTLYPNFDQKIPYTWIEIARDTVYPKPLAGPELCVKEYLAKWTFLLTKLFLLEREQTQLSVLYIIILNIMDSRKLMSILTRIIAQGRTKTTTSSGI